MIQATELGQMEVRALREWSPTPSTDEEVRTPLPVVTHRVTIYVSADPPLTIKQLESLAYDLGIPRPQVRIEKPTQTTYDLIGAFHYGYVWRCKACGAEMLGDRHNNLPTHECTHTRKGRRG